MRGLCVPRAPQAREGGLPPFRGACPESLPPHRRRARRRPGTWARRPLRMPREGAREPRTAGSRRAGRGNTRRRAGGRPRGALGERARRRAPPRRRAPRRLRARAEGPARPRGRSRARFRTEPPRARPAPAAPRPPAPGSSAARGSGWEGEARRASDARPRLLVRSLVGRVLVVGPAASGVLVGVHEAFLAGLPAPAPRRIEREIGRHDEQRTVDREVACGKRDRTLDPERLLERTVPRAEEDRHMEPEAARPLLHERLREIQPSVAVEVPANEEGMVAPVHVLEVPAIVGLRRVAVLRGPEEESFRPEFDEGLLDRMSFRLRPPRRVEAAR